MTIQQHASFDSSAAELNATSKLVKAWESKNAKNAAKAGGISLMALSLAACGGSSDTAASGDTAADDTAADDTTTPVADPVVEGSPSVEFDQVTGTAGADVVNYFVVQNANGEQTNQFGTGDQINLAGGADVLNVVVQDASSLNAEPTASIAAYLTGVETANFTALNDSDTSGANGSDTVEINGAFWLGTDVISSVASDASLTVYNVNTLGSADAYGDVGALTSTMTVRMDHTGNDNRLGDESDMTVLFDEDYLIAGSTTSASDATFFILDQDGAEQDGMDTPLMHSVDADNRVDAAGETVVFTDSIGISFELDGVATSVSLTNDQIEAARNADSYTHTDFVADLNENGGLPDGVTIAVDGTSLRTTFLDDGSAYSIPAIVVSSANGGTFSNQSFVSREATGVEFNEYGRFENTDPTTSGQTEINVELEKVGRDGDGGDLIIGGMEDSGIQVFNVEVQGRADQPTSLASLASTNNTLEEVNVVAAAGSEASLEIGNDNTVGAGLTDVRIIDASTFDNGATLDADITDASVAKYMVRTDTAGDASADNADFAYTTGSGADTLDINISEANLAASGTANREDFSMAVSTGAGNDSITMQIGDGDMGDVAWANHAAMDANADSRIGVDAGAGDDMVHTNGETIFRIDLGAGNDAGYTDNSGAQATTDFNEGRATWVMGTTDQTTALAAERDIDDLASDTLGDTSLYGATVSLTYKGYVVESDQITDFNTTTLEMNNIIKGLIQGDEHLSDLIVAEDGPGNTLVVRSLIDGVDDAADFEVTTAFTNWTAVSDATLAAFNAATGHTAANTAAINSQVAANVVSFNAHDANGDDGLDVFAAGFNDALAVETGASTSEVQTATLTAADGAGEDVTVTVLNAAGATVGSFAHTAGAAESAADIGAALVVGLTNLADAGEDLEGYTFEMDGDALIITSPGAAGDVDPATVVYSVSADVVPVETVKGDVNVVDIAGANSTADNANTITDGTGEDTIVLSTDSDSAETVVLVADGETDVIVNFDSVSGDVVDLSGYGMTATWDFDMTTPAAIADADDDFTDDGEIYVVAASAANDTAAEVLALFNDDESATATDHEDMLYIVDEADAGFTIYHINDGAAAGDATIQDLGTFYLL